MSIWQNGFDKMSGYSVRWTFGQMSIRPIGLGKMGFGQTTAHKPIATVLYYSAIPELFCAELQIYLQLSVCYD